MPTMGDRAGKVPMLKVWNRLPALAGAGALLGSLAFAPACGDEEKPAAGEQPDLGGPTDPLVAPDLAWKYFEFPDAYCRDGSPAGISVNLNPDSKNLMIYLEGGGACFDGATCAGNPARVLTNMLQPQAGLFDRSNAANPVKDWNFVYVPYCTGDNHTGTNPNGMIDNLPTQKFVGYLNMAAFLKRLKPTFSDAERVLLTGISAGGFGAAGNVPQVTRAFPDAKGNLIDDSGPAMSNTFIVPCLQKKWNELWGLDKSIIAECGASCTNPDNFVLDYALFLADKYSKQTSGMIETTEDIIIRGFFGVGANDCTGNIVTTQVPPATFKEGLLDFRERVKAFPNFGTYFPAGNQHTWLGSRSVYEAEVGGVRMIDWVRDIVTDTKAAHVGPP